MRYHRLISLKGLKKAGVKFTVGTNNADENFSGAEYALKMIKECKLYRRMISSFL